MNQRLAQFLRLNSDKVADKIIKERRKIVLKNLLGGDPKLHDESLDPRIQMMRGLTAFKDNVVREEAQDWVWKIREGLDELYQDQLKTAPQNWAFSEWRERPSLPKTKEVNLHSEESSLEWDKPPESEDVRIVRARPFEQVLSTEQSSSKRSQSHD